MNYLVMECHPGYAVVLSKDGRFLKVANLRYEVGQTVTDVIEATFPQQSVKTRSAGWIIRLGTMAACLVLVIAAALFYGQMPYASVYMTINPQIRIDVNRKDTVLKVEDMNPDGAYLLHGYDPGRKDLDMVMDELVDRAIDMGYLHEGGKITLELDGKEGWVNSHQVHLNDHLTEHLTDKVKVTVDVQKSQSPQTASTNAVPEPAMTPAGPIVIPVTPDAYGSSDYGSSDYGDSDYGDSDYTGSTNAVPAGAEVFSDYASDSNYEAESFYEGPDSNYNSASTHDSGYSDYDASGNNAEKTNTASSAASHTGQTSSAPVPEAADSDYADVGESSYGHADAGGWADDSSDYDESDYDD